MSAIAGRVMPLMKGEYNSATTYEPLDFVTYNNALWGCIKTSKGNTPSESTHWKKAIDGNVSDAASLGGETAEQWQAKLDTIQTTSRATLSQAGWYRVAEYKGTKNSATGASTNSCVLEVKRVYGNQPNENHVIRLNSANLLQQFVLLNSFSKKQLITKIRYAHESLYTAYLEVYYTGIENNITSFSVYSPEDGAGYSWQAITPTLTAETVDGVTVTTVYDIPANAKPVTDINGNITVKSDTATNVSTDLKNSVRDILNRVYADGTYRLYDITNDTYIILSKADGTNTFNGTASGNLPLDGGGTVQAANSNPLKVKNTSGNDCYIPFVGKGGTLGYLGFSDTNSLMFVTADATAATVILHTGNSARVVPATSAPSDTTVLWIDTANKKVKSYIDGAWTALA